MVITVEIYKEIRRMRLEGKSQRQIAAVLHISRNTVKKYWDGNSVPWERKEYNRKVSVVTEDVVDFVRQCLDEDARYRSKKQHHTARHIYDRLVDEHGFTRGETTIRRLVKGLREKTQEAFVPLAFAAGDAMQIDWGEATVYLYRRRVSMQNKKDQHYVSRFYLKYFSENKKSIGMLRRSGFHIVEHASIKQVAYRDYMYGKDGELEEWLSKCERKWSRVIRYLFGEDDSQCADPAEYYILLLHFVQISLARTAKIADAHQELMDYYKTLIDEAEASGGKLAAGLEGLFIDCNTPNRIAIEIADERLDILTDLKPLTIINESGRGFITSDNPVVLYNPLYARRKYRINYGTGTGGIIIFLPLSPSVCFCLFDSEIYDEKSKDGFNITIKSKNQINELNKLFAKNAYEAIFWGKGVDADYAKRMGREFHTPSPSVEEFPIKGSNDSILRFGRESIFKEYQMPYFRIKDKYITMQLPGHMGGLHRQYAQEVEKAFNIRHGFKWEDSFRLTE